MAKSLFIFLLFFFFLNLLHRREYRKVLYHKCQIGSHSMMSHDMLHNECGKTVHKPCSSYISSIKNLIKTLLSSSC